MRREKKINNNIRAYSVVIKRPSHLVIFHGNEKIYKSKKLTIFVLFFFLVFSTVNDFLLERSCAHNVKSKKQQKKIESSKMYYTFLWDNFCANCQHTNTFSKYQIYYVLNKNVLILVFLLPTKNTLSIGFNTFFMWKMVW